ncbi:AMP-binding protein [Amycolatopsis sp. DG1A-15b]|uniref:AMP-binding protein n=1 Tax=Amycolatopsis sp. DG1A-15b TaxID=3052846 RepID=UPI00255C14E2|nr:AMP-binding protein [Amycolatopsis sp. DG1A-15b]WIX91331.1 AMP-binding protein [Amycolatopsis sp. DG1A-15b]
MGTEADATTPVPAAHDTFTDILRSLAADPKRGLVFGDQEWTWAELVQEAADRAAFFASLRKPAGRQFHVGLLLDNVPDYVHWAGVAGLGGAVIVGINSIRSASEIAVDVRHADVDLIITEPRLRHLVAGQDCGVARDRILDVDTSAYQDLLAVWRGAKLPTTRPEPGDLVALMFSFGSTGSPKAVILTQGRLARLTPVLTTRIELSRETTTYLCMPLFHGSSLMMNLVPAIATVGMVRKFSTSRFSGDVHRFGATYVNYVGRALSYVLANPEDPRDRTGTLGLGFGTEVSEADVRRFGERFGCQVIEGRRRQAVPLGHQCPLSKADGEGGAKVAAVCCRH